MLNKRIKKFTANLLLATTLLLGQALPLAMGQGAGNLPARPIFQVPIPTFTEGYVIRVKARDNLQQALDQVQPGDTLELEAGAKFVGRFAFKDKPDNGKYILVRSSRAGELSSGERVLPSDSFKLATLIPPDNLQAMDFYPTSNGFTKARKWIFEGIEVVTNPTFQPNSNLIKLGTNGSWQTSIEQAPEDIIFDHCFIHGLDGVDSYRAVSICGTRIAFINSYISNFHVRGGESQGILIANAPGPILIENCYVEGATENLMSGGLDLNTPNLVPSDITVRRNYFSKPLSWIGKGYAVKNLLELKNARRVLIEENVFENNWVDGQSGLSILFTPRNQYGRNPWAQVADITFINNTLKNVAGGFGLLGHDNNFPSQQTQRILIRGNTILGLGATGLGVNGRFLQLLDDSKDVIFENNSIISDGAITPIVFAGLQTQGLIFTDNIFSRGQNGMKGDGTLEGSDALRNYAPDAIFLRNVILGGKAQENLYPAGNYFTN